MSSRISILSSRIAENTKKLDDYLAAHGLPTPSFDVDGPATSQIPSGAPEIEAARIAIIDDTQELRRLVLGPRDYLMNNAHNELLSQQAIVRFHLAHAFPIGKEATFADIALASGLNESDVRQLLRMAVVQNIFSESRPGVITHNSVSRLLVEDKPLSDWVASSTDELWQAAAQTCNAMAKYPGSQEPTQTGFSVANQTERSIYEVFSQYPERARRFASAMLSYTNGRQFALQHLVTGFPWGDFKDGTVVDVGGSRGHACLAIGSEHPSLSLVVQDLESVVEAAKKEYLNDGDVNKRVSFMVHDFFNPQPVHGADVYLFRWIFHNWSDKYCIRILQALIPALKPGAKILVNDNVLPQPGTMSNWQETRLRSMDLTMKETQNSHERELDDWVKLFQEADSRFQFQGAVQPEGSDLWILTVEWKGD